MEMKCTNASQCLPLWLAPCKLPTDVSCYLIAFLVAFIWRCQVLKLWKLHLGILLSDTCAPETRRVLLLSGGGGETLPPLSPERQCSAWDPCWIPETSRALGSRAMGAVTDMGQRPCTAPPPHPVRCVHCAQAAWHFWEPPQSQRGSQWRVRLCCVQRTVSLLYLFKAWGCTGRVKNTIYCRKCFHLE